MSTRQPGWQAAGGWQRPALAAVVTNLLTLGIGSALVFWNRLHPQTLLDLMAEKNLFLRDFRLKQALGLPPESFVLAADVLGLDRQAECPDWRSERDSHQDPPSHPPRIGRPQAGSTYRTTDL
jgi:hypothetical protein